MPNAAFDRLFECDLQNYQEAKRALNTIDSKALETANECAAVFERVGQVFGRVCRYREFHEVLNNWLAKQPLPAEQAVKLLQRAASVGNQFPEDPTRQAKEALERLHSIIGRIYLLLRLGRDYLLGLGEILKLRITPAMGYLRVQAESLALLKLFANEPRIAQEWLDATSAQSGRQFYRNNHSKIVETVKALDLYEHYERGSWMALHSRVPGVSLGIIQGGKKTTGGEEDTIRLVYQETGDHVALFLWFCIYMRFHQKAINSISVSIPEINSLQLAEVGVGEFSKAVDGLWKTLEPIYRDWKAKDTSGVLSGI